MIHEYNHWWKTPLFVLVALLLITFSGLIALQSEHVTSLKDRVADVLGLGGETGEQDAAPLNTPSELSYGLTGAPVASFRGGTFLAVAPTSDVDSETGIFTSELISFSVPENLSTVLTNIGSVIDAAPLPDQSGYVFLFEEQDPDAAPDARRSYTTLTEFDATTGTETKLLDGSGYTGEHVTVSPDGSYVAFAQMTVPIEGDNWSALENWETVYHNRTTGETTRIPAATNPYWSADSERLAFLKEDGIYMRSLVTGEEYQVYGGYTPLTAGVEFAAHPNGDYLLITVPGLNLVSVNEVSTSTITEIGRFAADDEYYTNPTPGPNGDFYAVLARSTDDTADNLTMQIRAYESAEVVYSYRHEVPRDEAERTTLTKWIAE